MIFFFPMTLLLLFRGSGEAGPEPAEPTSFSGIVGLRPKLEGNTGQKSYLEGRVAQKPYNDGQTGNKG